MASIPITGLFVLFDMIVHSPLQAQTASNLALLDMVAGHFSRLEYGSGGTLPGSLIAEFSHIARNYVNEAQHRHRHHPSNSKSQGSGVFVDQDRLFESEPGKQLSLPHPESQEDTFAAAARSDVLPTATRPVETVPIVSQQQQDDHLTLPAESISHQTLQMDPLLEGFGEDYLMLNNHMLGTDVMGIFNNMLPGLDPMFYHGSVGDVEFEISGGNMQQNKSNGV